MWEAIDQGDIDEIERVVRDGYDLNARDRSGSPFLFRAIERCWRPPPFGPVRHRCQTVCALIDLGADPHAFDEHGASVLIAPIFNNDLPMLKMLLDKGVDPNRGCGEPYETLYDLASFDYYYEAWIQKSLEFPLVPASVRVSADSLMRYLDEQAIAHNTLRPTILYALRNKGALDHREMTEWLGGRAEQSVTWDGNAWRLNPELYAGCPML